MCEGDEDPSEMPNQQPSSSSKASAMASVFQVKSTELADMAF